MQTVAVDDSGHLYVGGDFRTVGEARAWGIAKWDGTAWQSVELPISGIEVSPFSARPVGAITARGSEVYVHGREIGAYWWNGSDWIRDTRYLTPPPGAHPPFGPYPGDDGYHADGLRVFGWNPSYVTWWDGAQWGSAGWPNGAITAFTTRGSEVFAAGRLESQGGSPSHHLVRSFSVEGVGTPLMDVGGPANGPIRCLAAWGTDLYAAGDFTLIGELPAAHIARWDGAKWWAVSDGLRGGATALEASDSGIVVASGAEADAPAGYTEVSRWDGQSWTVLGGRFDGTVRDMAVRGGEIFAVGRFSRVGEVVAHNIARWDGQWWSPVGRAALTGLNDAVHAFATSNGELHAGGSFTRAGVNPARRVARWDGQAWHPVGDGLDDTVWSLCLSTIGLIAGGDFTMGSTESASGRIARWDGRSWVPLGSGVNGRVTAVVESGANIYAGGLFTIAGGVPANHVARWDGRAWSSLGDGLNGPVLALTEFGGEVVAGGGFTHSGALPLSRVASWNGTRWAPLGTGIDGSVLSLAVLGPDLYAGGWFTRAGGFDAGRIARWNGQSWAPVIPLTFSSIDVRDGYNLAIQLKSGSALVSAYVIDQLSLPTKSALDSWTYSNRPEVLAPLTALILDDFNRLLLGDSIWNEAAFVQVGLRDETQALLDSSPNGSDLVLLNRRLLEDAFPDSLRRHSVWEVGFNDGVRSLAALGNQLLVGGDFTSGGNGAITNRVARWDGVRWNAVGVGVDAPVYAVAALDASLFVGGHFTFAGDTVSPWVARAELGLPQIGALALSIVASDGFIRIVFRGEPLQQYRVQSAPGMGPTVKWTDAPGGATPTAGPDGTFVFEADHQTAPATFYRSAPR